MIHNILRNGNFTSSEIVKLTKLSTNKKDFGEAAKTYIAEANFERYLDGPVDSEVSSKPTAWGTLCEPRIHEMLPMSYTYCSDVTKQHPSIPFWVGSKDGTNTAGELAVHDIKCPFTKKSFVQLVLPLYLGYTGLEVMYALRDGFNHNGIEYPKHTDGAKYYWQLVSNGEIDNVDYAELIVYMPFESELLEIFNSIGDDPNYRWLKNEDVPCIKDGGFFKNINIIRFKIPQSDKDFLKAQVLKAGELLITDPLKQQAA